MSLLSFLTGIEVAARSVMSPLPPEVWRPSSQTSPTPVPKLKNDAKPCCVFVPSRWGLTGADQVLPLSRDVEIFRSYASGSGPFISIQCATSDPSASARTEGTSAKLVMRCSLAMTTTGADHPAGRRSANFNAVFSPVRSSQLRSVLPPLTVICGDAESPSDGALSVSMVKAGRDDCCAAIAPWTRTAAASNPAASPVTRIFRMAPTVSC